MTLIILHISTTKSSGKSKYVNQMHSVQKIEKVPRGIQGEKSRKKNRQVR